MTISNPSGFIEGIDEGNLLSAQPRSRNPRLALIPKTAGYAEQTGRGVNKRFKIYIDSLANGGATPDYSQSTSTEVDLCIRRAVPDESFARMVSEEEKRRGASLSVWALILLSLLQEHHRLTMS